jgi:hypothetical protein
MFPESFALATVKMEIVTLINLEGNLEFRVKHMLMWDSGSALTLLGVGET